MEDVIIMREIFEMLSTDGYYHSPKIVDELPAGKAFKKQRSDLKWIDYEYVDQRSGGHPAGDDYYGTYAVQLPCGQYLCVDYG